MTEFKPFPKIARLYDTYNPIIVTEKADGSNGAIQVEDGKVVAAQSRKRIITPESDNHGFARWVYDNADTLASDLGDGTHFGEWVGPKIQRGYGLDRKKFLLFNSPRWSGVEFQTENLGTVPILFKGVVALTEIDVAVRLSLAHLEESGSEINPDFKQPEGVVVFFTSNNTGYKVIPPGWGKQGQKKDVADNFAIWERVAV